MFGILKSLRVGGWGGVEGGGLISGISSRDGQRGTP